MKFAQSEVNFGYVKVSQLDHLSAVRFGSTLRIGNCNTAKKTQGFGQDYSDGSSFVIPVSEVNDADGMDAHSRSRNFRATRF